MKQLKFFYIPVAISFLFSCAALYPELIPCPTVSHNHKLFVTDMKGNPLDSAKVSIIAKNNDSIVTETNQITSSDGVVFVKLNATSDPKYPSIYAYSTTVEYKIEKEGYYTVKYSTIASKSGQKTEVIDPVQNVLDTIHLKKPIDYFSQSYLASVEGTELKVKILEFIDNIRIEGYLGDSYLEPYSIDIYPFKNNKYLTFAFKNTNSYNSLKLNKYDIGKMLFDEVVRKVLNPLNSFISNPKDFYGYDITVLGFTKDFSEKYASEQKLKYQFLMPISLVSKYKEKEITGQGLIDSSVVLLDDERIDLKLQ